MTPRADLQERFPFPLVAVRGADALAELERLREAQLREPPGSAASTPVLLGGEDDVEFILENMGLVEGSPDELLLAAGAIDPDAWFRERADADPEQFEVELGGWPGSGGPTEITLHKDPFGRARPLVYIARVSTPHSWEVPAFLKMGGWNECPDAAAQVAVSRRWHERYGADLVAAGSDVVEYRVRRPPTDASGAERLAWEHFVYCSDVVHQGTETLRGLAASLQGAPVWSFWWD